MIAVDANVVMPLLREDALTSIARSVREADGDWLMPSLLAEEVGFEPTSRLRGIRFSRPARSTAPALLRSGRGYSTARCGSGRGRTWARLAIQPRYLSQSFRSDAAHPRIPYSYTYSYTQISPNLRPTYLVTRRRMVLSEKRF